MTVILFLIVSYLLLGCATATGIRLRGVFNIWTLLDEYRHEGKYGGAEMALGWLILWAPLWPLVWLYLVTAYALRLIIMVSTVRV